MRRDQTTGIGWRGLGHYAAIGLLAVSLGACGGTPRQSNPSAAVCTESKDGLDSPGAVVVDMENNPALPDFVASRIYAPTDIAARIGQPIVFRNADPDEQHTAELDDGACGTDYLDFDKRDSLIFNVAGTYAFYCLVHGTTMAGTITIRP